MPSDAQLVPVNQSPWDRIKAFVLDSVPSAHSRRAYDKALTDFLLWYQPKRPARPSPKPPPYCAMFGIWKPSGFPPPQ
jgi:predicted phosphoadenosine phosphosulfate sulfurtransferase